MTKGKAKIASSNYVFLYRSLSKKAFYKKDSEKVHLWVHMIMKAAWTEREEILGGKIITCKPGQFTTGRKQLSKETGINESKIERILNYFEKVEKQIEQQKTNTNRLITVLNWEQYQAYEQTVVRKKPNANECENRTEITKTTQQTEQQKEPGTRSISANYTDEKIKSNNKLNNNRTTTEQRPNTLKEYKNIKNIKNREEEEEEEENHTQYVEPTKRFEIKISELEEFLINEQIWLEQTVCMRQHITPERAGEFIHEFVETLKDRAEENKTPKDAKTHFINWLKLQKIKRDDTTKKSGDTNTKERRAELLMQEYQAIIGGTPEV